MVKRSPMIRKVGQEPSQTHIEEAGDTDWSLKWDRADKTWVISGAYDYEIRAHFIVLDEEGRFISLEEETTVYPEAASGPVSDDV